MHFMQPRAAWAAMPSTKYTTLTNTGAASTYTAPADGFALAYGTANAAGNSLFILNDTTGITTGVNAVERGDSMRVFIPVSKGETFIISYSGASISYYRFIYANGSAN